MSLCPRDRYLEYQLTTLTRPYEVAVVTYALMIANSVERNVAYNMLDSMKRKVGTYSVIHCRPLYIIVARTNAQLVFPKRHTV